MDIFRSVKQTVLGSPQSGVQPTGAETVERLLDRVQSSTLLEDRRDGCRALKALSRKYRLLVGAHGMDTLIQVLESDRNDHEIVNYALETLVNVTSEEIFSEDNNETEEEMPLDSIGEQFTEIFIKRAENIALIISLMDEFDFKVRFPAMKLLNNLLRNKPKELQEVILITPSGVSKLMDMLSDSREVIRNDTLLLLTDLTKGNTNLQKIVAFENAFDHLFAIVKEEGFSEGGVVVGDCLSLMFTLLKNNPSNQTLFKEGRYIQRMVDFFNLSLDSEVGWSAQKVANVHYMLKLLRILVCPQNAAQAVSSCQKVMKSCDLLEKLCTLLMAVGVPADILSDTILTVAELIRGNQENQEYFSRVTAPSNPPRPAIVVLLMSMVNEKQPFLLRCAVLYCFQCYLYRNPTSQGQIVRTLLPQTVEGSLSEIMGLELPTVRLHGPNGVRCFVKISNEITAGQLLCGGLFSSDPVSSWFSSIALSHALLDNTSQKEQLLRVQLATGVGSPPVSLLQQCTSLLQGGSKILTRLGILQLLCVWLAQCPIAVTHLLTLSGVIPNLTAYLSSNEQDEMEVICQGVCAFLIGLCAYFNEGSVPSFTREALTHLVSNRIGMENFSDKVENILKTEAYARAAKSPQLKARQPSDIIFDYEFTKLFKSLEASLLRTLLPEVNGSSPEIPSTEVIRYKDIIREQDEILTNIRQNLATRENQLHDLKLSHELVLSQLQELKLKASSTVPSSPVTLNGESCVTISESANDQATHVPVTESSSDQMTQLQQQLTEMTYARDYYYYQMAEKDNLLQKQGPNGQENQLNSNHENSISTTNLELENLRKQLEDLQLALYRKDEEIQHLKELPLQNCNSVAPTTGEEPLVKKLTEEKSSLESHLKRVEREKNDLEIQLREAKETSKKLEAEIARLGNLETNQKCALLETELEKLQNEQEDLLVLLTDQETKISEMKRSLRTYGEVFSDDDEDDEDEDGDLNIDVSSEDEDLLP